MRSRLFLSLPVWAATIALSTASASAGDWPQFRGPDGNATALQGDAPIRWSATENIVWKTPLPGRGASSPVVWGDRLFVTAYTGYGLTAEEPGDKGDLKLHVLCIDRSDGRILWDKTIAGSPHTQQATTRIVDHGFATGTPAVDGQAVYAFFGVSGVVAYDFDGNRLWQADVGSQTAGFGSASSPVLFENLVIINASIESSTLVALDKRSGKEVWKAQGINRAWTTPCLARLPDGSYELVVNQKDEVLAFNPRTGEKLWTCEGIDDYIVPVPVFHDGIVYCLGGRSNRSLAIKLGGRGDVTGSHKLWQVNIGANVTSPVYYNGHLYWSSDRGLAVCLDARTGEIVYRQRLPAQGRIYASIIRAGEQFYVTTRDRGVIVLKAQPSYEALAQNVIADDENLINAGPAVSDGQLFLRTDSFLYAIGGGQTE
jgi:outer membrane protein assembly factor BamB